MPGYPNAGYAGQAPYPNAAGFAGQLDQFGRPVQLDQFGRPVHLDQFGKPVQYDQYGRPILGPPVPVPLDLGAEEGAADDPDFVPAPKFQPPFIVSVLMVLTGFSGLLDWIADQRAKRSDEVYQNPNVEIYEFVSSTGFECLVGLVIVLNCCTIGWEASIPLGELSDLFGFCEHLFTLFFFVEWCLRILAFGLVWIFEFVNAADTMLVFGTGVLVKWVAEPMGMDLGNFRIITTLRALRLARLARVVRLHPSFKEMWILIHGLTTSAIPLLWTLLIAFCVLYVFAIAATELIGRSSTFTDHEEAQAMFGNFFRSMFTMVQLITMDTYCDLVVRPIMVKQPYLALFFIFFITVGVFIVMNLVTAIIVENAFAIVREDTESQAKEIETKKRRELKMLSDLFMEIDLDGSGELSKDELFASLKNKKVKQMLDLLEMKVGELTETWEVLDDGDGLLTIKEFTDGIRRMKGEAKAKDIADVIKKLRITDRKHLELQEQAARYSDTLHALERDAQEMATDTLEVVGLFKEMYHRLDGYIARGEKEDRARVREMEKLAKMAEAADSEEEEVTESEYDEEDEVGKE